MKVSTKATWAMIIITMIYTLSICVSVALRLQHIQPNHFFQLFNEITFIIPVIYMVLILNHLREKPLLIIMYVIYLVIDIFIVIYYVLSAPPTDYMVPLLVLFAGSIITVINIIIILTFSMQTRKLMRPFLFFGFTFLFINFFKLLGSLLIIFGHGDTLFQCTVPAEVLLPVAMLYVFFATLNYLKKRSVQKTLISNTDDDANGFLIF